MWTTLYTFYNKVNNLPDESKKKLVHSLDDILITCNFNYEQCTSADFVWKFDPVFGNCYSFNSGFNSTGGSVELKKSVIPGALFGLWLQVYVGYNEILSLINVGLSMYAFTNIYGLNVFIENNTYLTTNNLNYIGLDGGTIRWIRWWYDETTTRLVILILLYITRF